MEKEKRFGQVFTPEYLVKDILDFAGYVLGDDILEKHVVDNSCGDGAFLAEVVRRYAEAHFRKHGAGKGKKTLARQLGTFVHGIEIDRSSHAACMERLAALADELGLAAVGWDVRNADAMAVDAYDGKMDFVVGNPPYVRVHNLGGDFSRVKGHAFCGEGMTDLYLVFYEIGLHMLSRSGRLCYIAPSSWMNSVAGRGMREHLRRTGRLCAIADLRHFQPFSATAYTAIVRLENSGGADSFTYCTYERPGAMRFIGELRYDDAFFDDALFLGTRDVLAGLRAVKSSVVPSSVEVKNGFATLADDVFISDDLPFSDLTIPVVKASTGKWRKAFHPYDGAGRPLPREAVFANPQVAAYLEANKAILLKGRQEATCPNWFLYGRTQALKDVGRRKYAVNTVIRDVGSIKFNVAPEGTGVYGGLYVMSELPESQIRQALLNDDFIRYVSALGKYKSGGYYTFNSKELKQYLDYRLNDIRTATSGKTLRQQVLPLD